MGDGKHMDLGGLEGLLQAARQACAEVECPLSDRQLEVLHHTLQTFAQESAQAQTNPLDQLDPQERQIFIDFVQRQSQENQSWKTTLLNDWLQGTDSGAVQVIRDRYGLPWLDRVQPIHLAPYLNVLHREQMRLQVGDRIEVTNALWEWVQEAGPCSREWFPCTVIGLKQVTDLKQTIGPPSEPVQPAPAQPQITGIVRFDTGSEYEIPAIYDWNRPNWRWIEP
jgi:hypothetical protein